VQTKPKCEHVAGAHLRLLDEVEVFCPRIRYQKATRRGKVWFQEALFPCYLFARFDPQVSHRAVRYANAVSRIVQFGEVFSEIPDEVIEALRAEMGAEEVRRLEFSFEEGDEVIVAEGSLQGLEGLVTRPTTGSERVQILLDFLGQQTLVQLDRRQLTLAGNARAALAR